MITTHLDPPRRTEERLASTGLPPDAVIERMPLPTGGSIEIVRIGCDAGTALDPAAHDGHLADLVTAATAWIADGAPIVTIPLYGTHVVWSPRRAALIGPEEKLPHLRAAVADFSVLDAELRDIETRIAAAMVDMDDDARLAFDFTADSLPRHAELAARFTAAIAIRKRLALLAPTVHLPAPQPPTLAGQLGERLRDRTRTVERLEHATEQSDLLERVYSLCGDRASEYTISRRHATLEWLLIVLLAAEVLLFAIDLLAARAK